MTDLPPIAELMAAPVVALDTECTGLDWVRGDRVFSVALAWQPPGAPWPKTWYGDVRHGMIHEWLQDALQCLDHLVAHYAKFDAHMCRVSGYPTRPGAWECTMIRECLLDEDQYDYSLERISQDRLGRGKENIWAELARIFGGKADKATQILNLSRAPEELASKYARMDALNCLLIYQQQQQEIYAQDLQRVADMERRLLAVVVDMERGGVRVDSDRASRAIPQLDARIGAAQRRLDSVAGRPINVNSSPQVKQLLGVHQEKDGRWFTGDRLLLEPTKSGKSGELKTEKLYQCKMPGAVEIAQIRGMIKARDVFLKKYVLEMSYKGYVHANINQTRSEDGDGTYTGRFSITEPALQQIHKRNKEMAAIVRACFIPDEGCEWGSWDWAQVDFRCFAEYLHDPRIDSQYKSDARTDFHKITAELSGLPRNRDEKTGGANAKQINLAMVFGMSAGRLAKECNLPYTKDEQGFMRAGPEAEALFAKYHNAIPGVQRLRQSVASVAKSRGYIRTKLGRRIRLNPGHAYKAAGLLYQAAAAEMCKVKMVELAELLRPTDGRFMLTVHDEFNISLLYGRDKDIDEAITECLQRFDGSGFSGLSMRIPILAEAGLGENWYEAST